MTPLDTARAELAAAWPVRLRYLPGSHGRENAHAWIRALVRRVMILEMRRDFVVTGDPESVALLSDPEPDCLRRAEHDYRDGVCRVCGRPDPLEP